MIDIITRFQETINDNDSVRTNRAKKGETSVSIIREYMVNPKIIEEKTTVFAGTIKKNSNSDFFYH